MNKKVIILICSLILVISLVILFSSVKKTSTKYVVSTLTKNNYVLDEIEESSYIKKLTTNTMDEYFDDVDQLKDSSFKQYSMSLYDSTLVGLYMFNNSDTNNIITIMYSFITDKITFDYNIMNDNFIVVNGNFNDNSLTCNLKSNNIDKSTLDNYCEVVKNELISFLSEKKIFTDDLKFVNIMKNLN